MAKKQLTIEEKLQAALVPVEEQPYKVPENWCWVKFSVTYDNVSSSKNKIKQKDYQNEGKFAIVDQGENLIGGYSNNEDIVYDGELPVIIFGDHTRRIKYVDFPFIQGADGVKVLQPKNYIVPRYYFFGLQSMQIPHMGYRRHFPILNKMGFPIAPIAEQSRIVARIESLFAKLDEAKEKIQEVLDGADLRRAAILHQAFTGKLTEKWRKENSVDDKSWEFTSLGNICYINPKKIDTTNLDDNMEVSFIPMADVSDISEKNDCDINVSLMKNSFGVIEKT
jgi:type I restriction enzyme S subunit